MSHCEGRTCFFLYIFIMCLFGLCSTQDLGSSLQHAGSFTVACQLRDSQHHGIQFPDGGWNLGSLSGEHGVSATGPPGKSLHSSYSGATGNISVHHRFTDLDKSPCISSFRGCCFCQGGIFSPSSGPKSMWPWGGLSPSSSLACQRLSSNSASFSLDSWELLLPLCSHSPPTPGA